MRFKIFTIIILFFGSCHAQKIIKPLGFTEDSISISTNIKIHDAVSFENLVITFEKVLVDSRCPKDVNCVRAGEAEILVSIFKDDVFVKNKTIIIDAEGYIFENNNMFFKIKDYKLYLSALYPYPKANEKIIDDSYNANFFAIRDYRQ